MRYVDRFGVEEDEAVFGDEVTGFRAFIVRDEVTFEPDWDMESEDEIRAYEAGEVYGFIVVDADGEHVDSCWGFYEFYTPYDPDSYLRASTKEAFDHARAQYMSTGLWVTI